MIDLVFKQDMDRCLNRQQWKSLDRFRRISRKMVEQSLSEYDWQGHCRDLLLYGTACYKTENGKMVHIPFKKFARHGE